MGTVNISADVHPRPKYQAPEYRAAGERHGKVALITGEDSGIGRAVAVLCAHEGPGFDRGEATLLDYASTKGAIHAFTKSLAQNLVEMKIRVNAVAPDPVWTPLNTVAKNATDVSRFGA